jgi:hypothetical protein
MVYTIKDFKEGRVAIKFNGNVEYLKVIYKKLDLRSNPEVVQKGEVITATPDGYVQYAIEGFQPVVPEIEVYLV